MLGFPYVIVGPEKFVLKGYSVRTSIVGKCFGFTNLLVEAHLGIANHSIDKWIMWLNKMNHLDEDI